MENNQWVAVAPSVAVELWGEPTSRKGEREMRWGRKGSKSLTLNTGRWYDFENDRGGGVLELVEIECKTDRKGAIQWMRSNGYLPETSRKRNPGRFKARSGRPTQHRGAGGERKRVPHKPKGADTSGFALKLWNESEKIGDNSNHPFRRWARERNLLHPWCSVPAGIRWHEYRGGVIVAGVFPLHQWGSDGIPSGDPVAVQCLALDERGENRYCLGKNRDLRRCSYGPVSAGVFMVGDPTGKRVNIVEGVADALAVFSREQGAVLASLGSMAGFKPDVIEWLTKNQVWIFPDRDKAGDRGSDTVIIAIKEKSPDARVKIPSVRVSEDPGEWAENTPFAGIERYDFEEKSGIFFENGLPLFEADRMAIQTLMRRSKQ